MSERFDGNRLDGVTALAHLGVICVQGEDAATFLHAQLTQDFALLGTDEARLAAWCNAKGRMLASFIGFRRSQGDIVLVMSRDILPQVFKRLSMFVLRSKVKLRDATAQFALYGVAAATVRDLAPDLRDPWSRVDSGDTTAVALYPADGVARAMLVAPAGAPEPRGARLSHDDWMASEVRSGVATITSPIVEAFVPQMLNYESVGGVNFKKGCYPGQEVVARSQFRGTLKRRAYLAHGADELRTGQEVFHPGDIGQPCGTVAQAAPSPGGGWDAIVSMQVAAFDGSVLTAGGPTGIALALEAPPYPLLADV